jgi:hypothetical protein
MYWFRAKRYGLGWVPSCWQGWTVLALFVALVGAGPIFLPPNNFAAFLAYVALLSVLFIVVCWLKGEPLRWGGE